MIKASKMLIFFSTVLLLMGLVGCGTKDPVVATEPTVVENDPFYFNIDKALYGTTEHQKDRVSGTYPLRFMKEGQIVELKTVRDNVPAQLDNLKAVVPTFDDEGMVKKLQSAQSAIGGQFFDIVKVVALDSSSITLEGRADAMKLAETVFTYDVTGLTAEIGAAGQVQLDDTVCCYLNTDGVISHIFIIDRRLEHENNHTCDHCAETVDWQIWDGTQALSSGHYYIGSDIELQQAQCISKADVVLCLNGHALTGRNRLFELKDGASITITDHAGFTGRFYGSMIGGGVPVKDKEAGELIGGTLYGAQGTTVNICGGNIGVELPADKSRNINRGGVIYTEGELNVSGGVITGGDVGYNGGAIYIGEKGSFNLSGGVIRYGSAFKQEKVSGSGRGGTIYIHKNAVSASITGGKLIAGTVDGYGGGIYTEIGMDISNAVLCGDRIDGKPLAEYGGVFWLGGSETVVNVNAGTVFENGSSIEGGNIGHRSTAIVNINDGVVIRNGYATRNGGNVGSFGTFNMNGGQIIDGYTEGGGGNIYGFSNGYTYVNIIGGVISNGSGARGGNIYMNGNNSYEQGSVLTITGGEIKNGVARTETGGNVAVRANSEAYITGGKITGGTAEKNGGGFSTHYSKDNGLVVHVEIGGSAYIADNIGSDLYICPETVLYIKADAPFTSDAKIGLIADMTDVPLVIGLFKEDLGVFSWTPGDKTLTVEGDQLFAK